MYVCVYGERERDEVIINSVTHLSGYLILGRVFEKQKQEERKEDKEEKGQRW